jgi:phosphoribosylamine-glycine ligase
VLTDGTNVVPLHVVRSEKRRDLNDAGPNTDGMGAWLPVEELYEQQIEEAIDAGIKPALADYADRGMNYVGVLYADVMFTKTGPKVLEYNCRFGDLEVQAMVRTMDDDLLDLLHRTATGNLAGVEIAEPIGDQRHKAAAPRGRGKRTTRGGGNQHRPFPIHSTHGQARRHRENRNTPASRPGSSSGIDRTPSCI